MFDVVNSSVHNTITCSESQVIFTVNIIVHLKAALNEILKYFNEVVQGKNKEQKNSRNGHSKETNDVVGAIIGT